MSESLQDRADARLDEALREHGARDPREYYRDRLRAMKAEDSAAYEKAVGYYRETLLPEIVDGADPLAAWTEYGRRLSELLAPGRTVSIDRTGRARAYERPADPEALVIHLPDGRRAPTLLVGLPAELSPAQQATFTWLVKGKNRLPDAG